MKKLIVLVCLLLPSCVSDAAFRSYVAAHRLSHSASAVKYARYIDNDTSLSIADKITLKAKIEAEDAMITEAEKLLGIK